MKKVLVFGVFDLFHFGHLRLLKRASKLGDYCIVAVQSDEYIRLVDEYISDGFGIYDDTADLHRSIAWSDMHYGDENSVMRLYLVTGKPIIIQDYSSKLNPWSIINEQSGDVITEKEKSPVNLDDDLAYNLDGTCGIKIWEYVKKEVNI